MTSKKIKKNITKSKKKIIRKLALITKKTKQRKSKTHNRVNKRSKGRKKRTKKLEISNLPVNIKPIVPVEEEKKKKRAKKTPIMYFTQDTEDAIIAYNSTADQDVRNNIYETQIKYSFEKLVENIFNTFKFTYFETSPLDLQKETVTHLVANINKFEKGKGKAFSYFSIVAKHYLIFHNNNNYKRFNQNVDISETPSDTTVCLQTEDAHYKTSEMSDFIKMMISYWEANLGVIFKKQRDLNIANAVIELFRNSDRIEAYNKKALYVYIREISSCKTQQITKVINKMRHYQQNITKSYIESGNITDNMYIYGPSGI